jgi:hypothetical protein
MDEDTILYNLQIHKQYQLNKLSLIKILHLKNHRLAIVLTDTNKTKEDPDFPNEENGFDIILNKMQNFFNFTPRFDSDQTP